MKKKKKYHTLGTDRKSNKKIVERHKSITLKENTIYEKKS